MSRTLNEILETLPPERRERIARRADEMAAEIDSLAELRKLAELTQGQVAETLGVSQPTVHQIEKRTDVYLSTLRRFVAAAGGELELRVTLPGKGTFRLSGVGDLTTRQSQPTSRTETSCR